MVVGLLQKHAAGHRELEKGVAKHLQPLVAAGLAQRGRGTRLEHRGHDLERRGLQRAGLCCGAAGGRGEEAEVEGTVVGQEGGAEAEEDGRQLQERPPAARGTSGGVRVMNEPAK